jgi:pimeloyl-ACP methyl ester carboxylesterase
MDTPVEDPSAGHAEHAAAVACAMEGAEPPVVLVGHSAGGAFLPLAGQLVDAAALVFLAAMVPVEGESCAEQRRREPGMVTMPPEVLSRDELGRTLAPPAAARHFYYQDCPPAVAAWATARLRWQAPTVMAERFVPGGWPAVPAAYVYCEDDRAVAPEWSRRVARERLGTEAVALPGGHSPFLSRPAQLAEVLSTVALALL